MGGVFIARRLTDKIWDDPQNPCPKKWDQNPKIPLFWPISGPLFEPFYLPTMVKRGQKWKTGVQKWGPEIGQKWVKNGSFWENPYMAAYKAFLEQNRFCLRARARARAREGSRK